jgi:thymidylate synthase
MTILDDKRGGQHARFNQSYSTLLTRLMSPEAVEEKNARTDVAIRALPGGESFKLHMNSTLPMATNRAYYPHVAAAETAWQFMGTKDPEFILRHAPKLWSKFVEDGELKTAYGYRWSKAFGRDQLQMAIDQLKINPTNRQLVVMAWDASCDGLGQPDQPKNIPCPIGFTLSALAGALHMSVFIRSSDVFVGLPYDVMCYALTLDAIASEVGLVPGTIHFSLAHAHIYKPHWLVAKANLGRLDDDDREVLFRHSRDHTQQELVKTAPTNWPDNSNNHMPLPGWSVSQIRRDPDGYVATVKTLAKRRQGLTDWDPKPIVVE